MHGGDAVTLTMSAATFTASTAMGAACILLVLQGGLPGHRQISLFAAMMLALSHTLNALILIATTIATRLLESEQATWACTIGSLGSSFALWGILGWSIAYIFCVHVLLLGHGGVRLVASKRWLQGFAWGVPCVLLVPPLAALGNVDAQMAQLEWSSAVPWCLDWNVGVLLSTLHGPSGRDTDWRLLTIVPVSLGVGYGTFVFASIVHRFYVLRQRSCVVNDSQSTLAPTRQALLSGAEDPGASIRASYASEDFAHGRATADGEAAHPTAALPPTPTRHSSHTPSHQPSTPTSPSRAAMRAASASSTRASGSGCAHGRAPAGSSEWQTFRAVERRLGLYYVIFFTGASVILLHGAVDMAVAPTGPEVPMPRALISCDALTSAAMGLATAAAFFHNRRNRPTTWLGRQLAHCCS